jgi:hypothetical protein
VLLLSVFCLTSCINDDDSDTVYYYYDEPVMFEPVGNSPLIRTEYDTFHAPDLAGQTLQKGDLLWSTFTVDLKIKPTPDETDHNYYTATNFKYTRVSIADVIVPENGDFESYLSDDYSEPISSAGLYKSYLDSTLFFGFKHENQSDNMFVYELVLNPEEENSDYPTLYIRAKKVGIVPVSTEYKKDEVIFAFNMLDFINYYKKNISNTGLVKFNLKYKTGQTADGKDIYREFNSNPLSWNIMR